MHICRKQQEVNICISTSLTGISMLSIHNRGITGGYVDAVEARLSETEIAVYNAIYNPQSINPAGSFSRPAFVSISEVLLYRQQQWLEESDAKFGLLKAVENVSATGILTATRVQSTPQLSLNSYSTMKNGILKRVLLHK